jgi:hypothetical protein
MTNLFTFLFTLMRHTMKAPLTAIFLALLWTVTMAAQPALAAKPVLPATWWVVGPFPCYDEAMFQAAEPIENARNEAQRGNEWNRVMAMGGRELRPLRVNSAQAGVVDLAAILKGASPNACAYAAVRLRADKVEQTPATLTNSGPVRWFLNNAMVAESKQEGTQQVSLKLKAGWNCLLAKSWNPNGSPTWNIGCEVAAASVLREEPQAPVPAAAGPSSGRRNVALWSEGSRVAVSSIVWRGFPTNECGLSMLNDGRKPAAPGGPGAAWNSLEVDGLPQWAWVRFPGMRKVEQVVIHAASRDRQPIDLVGECTEDGGATFKTLFAIKDATFNKDLSLKAAFPPVVTDNVRIRIDRAAVPSKSGFVTAQLPGKRVLSNNVVSTNCPLSMQFYAEMAVYAPQLQDGISLMDLVAASVDRYLDGLGGHLMWHGFKVEVSPPGTWYASLESGGFILNSAWYAVRTLGGRPLLDRWLPRLEALAGHLEARDVDGDGIVESGDRGHWFDTYALDEGVKEAHSTAVNYEAFLHLADLEDLAGRSRQAAHYRGRAFYYWNGLRANGEGYLPEN